MVQKSLAQQTQSEPPSPPSKGNPPPKPDEVCLTHQEWEEVCDCSQALFDAVQILRDEGGVDRIELLVSVQKRLSRLTHTTTNRLLGKRQSFQERSEDDDGILPQ